jgi:hypothetical protein
MTGPYSHVYDSHHIYHQQGLPVSISGETSSHAINMNNRPAPPIVNSGFRAWLPSRIFWVAALSLSLYVYAVILEMQRQTEAHQDHHGNSNVNFAYFQWDDNHNTAVEDGPFNPDSRIQQAATLKAQPASKPKLGPIEHSPTLGDSTTSANLFRNAAVPTLIHLRRDEEDSAQSDTSDGSDGSDGVGVSSNPQIYGWTPEMYPNPLLDPVRCSIAFLPEEQQAIMKRAISNGDNRDVPEPLRLCDPDWMLGGMYMEQIAFALRNFSDFFSQPDWDVTVGSAATNQMPKAETPAKVEAQTAQGRNASAGSPAISTATQEQHSISVQPRVQLAVATVRKVRLSNAKVLVDNYAGTCSHRF